MKVVVTTGRNPAPRSEERAALLAARFSLPLVKRGNLETMADPAGDVGADCFYIVRRTLEQLRHKDGRSAHVQPGMMPTKLQQGEAHPFIRAVRGQTREAVDTIFDATLGLANDAVHLAAVTGARVRGVEASPVLFALLEEGLPRIANGNDSWADAAARVNAEWGDSEAILAATADDSFDVVVIDPMMSRPRRNAPSFDLVRDFAKMDRASARLLLQARRVARRRVVFKLGKGAPLPADHSIAFPDHLLGAHVAYWIHEKARDGVFGEEQPSVVNGRMSP